MEALAALASNNDGNEPANSFTGPNTIASTSKLTAIQAQIRIL
jgi:hypothetical protein